MATGELTTHVLDTARGGPAVGIEVRLLRLGGDRSEVIVTATTNARGRTDAPLLAGDDFLPGRYQLSFEAGRWFADSGLTKPDYAFLDVIQVQFGIDDGSAHYHVPLLLSPFGYTVYRGA